MVRGRARRPRIGEAAVDVDHDDQVAVLTVFIRPLAGLTVFADEMRSRLIRRDAATG